MKKSKNTTWILSLGIFLVTMIFIPILLNDFFKNGRLFFLFGRGIKTGEDLGNVEWLAFWGSFLGGAATMIAVFLTLRQNTNILKQNDAMLKLNKDMLKNNEKTLEVNKENQEFQEENLRLTHMPYIDVRFLELEDIIDSILLPPSGFVIIKNDNKTIRKTLDKYYREAVINNFIQGMPSEAKDKLTIEEIPFIECEDINFVNILIVQKSSSLAKNLTLSYIKLDESDKELTKVLPPIALASNESIQLPVLFDKDCSKSTFKFIVMYEDIRGYKYEQFFLIQNKGFMGYSYELMSQPTLLNKIK